MKTALNRKITSIKENQAKSTKPNLQNKVTKAKPQNSIQKPNWQIQNMLVNQSK